MEKLTVRIGKVSPTSATFNPTTADSSNDVTFLQTALEISEKRAIKINDILEKECNLGHVSAYIVVNLSYKQLAKYTAKRQVEGLNKYWKYPHVLKYVEDEDVLEDYKSPYEIRPGIRRA